MDSENKQFENLENSEEINQQPPKRRGLFSFLRSDKNEEDSTKHQEEELIDTRLEDLEVSSEEGKEEPESESDDLFSTQLSDWDAEIEETQSSIPDIDEKSTVEHAVDDETENVEEVNPAFQNLDEINKNDLQSAGPFSEERIESAEKEDSEAPFSYTAFSERMDAFAESTKSKAG